MSIIYTEEPIIYRLNDDISFRKCTLAEDYSELEHGNCTNWDIIDLGNGVYFRCRQHGIHLHCSKHPNVEFKIINRGMYSYLKCERCKDEVIIDDLDTLIQECTRVLNMEEFKNANIIRINDFYYPEVKEGTETKSDYWIKVEVKQDKDNDTMIVVYVGKKHSKEKVQYFIKPEKLELSHDHKDLDPATILSKIEITLKDRKIKQEYDEEDK